MSPDSAAAAAPVSVHRSSEQGFDCVHLESADLRVTVVPELGARLLSLRDKPRGREWLWRPAGPLKLWRNRLDDPFPSGTFAGADECLPTIGACTWRGRRLPDHGEAWSMPWALDAPAFAAGRIKTTARLPRSPLSLTRELTLSGPKLRMSYTLENLGAEPEAWLWAWHPLITHEAGDRLELPGEVDRLRVETALNPDAARGAVWPWPRPAPGVDLAQLQLGPGDAYVKAFAGPLTEGRARLSNPQTGAALTLRWDARALPYLGLWLTRGGYQGWHHVALEPTNLPADSLLDGQKENTPVPLGPREQTTWWLELDLGAA